MFQPLKSDASAVPGPRPRRDAAVDPGPRVEPDLRVGFVFAPNFTLLAFSGFIEALRHSADEADRSRQMYCRWTCLGPDEQPIRASCGVEILPWEGYGDPETFDYVVVVGGLMSAFHRYPASTFDFLRLAADRRVPVVGLCTGSFALAEAGLLAGRRCAVHMRHREELLARYPDVTPVTDELYVIDGDRYTSPGGTATIDLALALIVRHCGKARALKGLAQMVMDQHRAAHDVPPHPYEHVAHCGEWRVERAINLMQHNLSEPCAVQRLAAQLGTTVRQLDRAFAEHAHMSPSRFWRELRLQHARWRLASSSRTVTEIAQECGFADGAHLGRWFRRKFGESPHAYRNRCRQVAMS